MLITMQDFSLKIPTADKEKIENWIYDSSGKIISVFDKNDNMTTYHVVMPDDGFNLFTSLLEDNYSNVATITI